MFSRTTIASSIRIPIANESPISDIVSRLKPNAQTAMKLARTEIGSATPVMTVERHELRNRKTTSTVRNAPRNSASSTFFTAFVTRTPASFTMSIFVPFGSVALSCARRSRTRVGDIGSAIAFGLLDVDADRFLAVIERERARLGRRVLDRRDLSEPNDLPVAVGDDEVLEFSRVFQTAVEANRALVESAVHAPHGAARFCA
jgi:hypothetical protein